MKKIILLLVMLAGCAVTSEKTDEAQSNLCTVEDQISGLCNGPFTSLAGDAISYYTDVMQDAPTGDPECGWSWGGKWQCAWCGFDFPLGDGTALWIACGCDGICLYQIVD